MIEPRHAHHLTRPATQEVRDAVLTTLQVHPSGAPVGEIVTGVRDRIGEVPESSIRSYLRLNTPRLLVRPQRGHYRLSEGRASDGESASTGDAPAMRRFRTRVFGRATVVHADCVEWLRQQERSSVHAFVTDPPYGQGAGETAQRQGWGMAPAPVVRRRPALPPTSLHLCGAGSTLAAAEAVGYRSIGIESDPEYFDMACHAISRLAIYRRERADL